MPPKPSQSDIAGLPRRAAARGHDAGQRRHPAPTAADRLRELSDEVDEAMRLESLGPRGAAEHDRLVAMIETIAALGCALKEHYRGPSSRPCRLPAYVSADGTRCGW